MAPRFVVLPNASFEVRQTAYAAVLYSWNVVQAAASLYSLWQGHCAGRRWRFSSFYDVLRPSLSTRVCFCAAIAVLCAREIYMQCKTRHLVRTYSMHTSGTVTLLPSKDAKTL